MPRTHRALLVGIVSLLLLSGCDPGVTESSTGLSGTVAANNGAAGGSGGTVIGGLNGNPPGITGTKDTVIATASVGGTVSVATGASQTLSVTFTSSDGRAMRGLAISDTTLPAGWSGIENYSCTLVGSGSSCVANLTYAPQQVGTGSLTLNYIYIDNANEPQSPGGSLIIPYAATSHNNVLAAVAPTGQVNAVVGAGSQSVTINFTTDDGNAATGLALTSELTALPSGWTVMAPSFSCAIVSTGSGCQLVLSYAPAAASSGTLTLSYGYTDDSGTSRTGMLNIPYSSMTSGNVVATVAPTGQVNAIQKAGQQPVTVTFTTDDGKQATNLVLQSKLNSLPSGWSAGSSGLSCGTVSTGNGCQLTLNYAPLAIASGTLTLNYDYFDAAGTYSVGSVNIGYAATTNDNVVGTAAPSGQINAVVGLGTQPVLVTFTTDDGRPATALQLTSSLAGLPSGWSSTDVAFTCAGLSSGNGCQLPLTYSPPAASNGTVVLTYSYRNNAGQPRTGSVNIPFRATTDDNVVATPSPNPITVQSGTTTAVTVTFTMDDGNPGSNLSVTAGLTSLPAGWNSPDTSFSCSSLSVGTSCQLPLTYAPMTAATGTLTLGFSYANNSGIIKSGTVNIAYTATP